MQIGVLLNALDTKTLVVVVKKDFYNAFRNTGGYFIVNIWLCYASPMQLFIH